jgi:uncharacterized membrane protein
VFQLLFKYPQALFLRGRLVFLAPWPSWLLWLLIALAAGGLAALIVGYLPRAASRSQRWRAAAIWMLQSLLVAVLLVLLWQPALSLAELKDQQNIVAVLIDDSRSMSIVEDGSSRESRAIAALRGPGMRDIARRFQLRLYRFDTALSRIDGPEQLQAEAAATHIGTSLRQLSDQTSGLPLGAVILLSDGADNGDGLDAQALAALRDRRVPVHTVGFGEERPRHDVELEAVEMPQRTLADSRVAALLRFHQFGYTGRSSHLSVREGARVLSSQTVVFGPDGAPQSQSLLFDVGAAGVKSLQFSIDTLPGEQNEANNAMSRLLSVDATQRSILYVEGEPRWEFKFIRRAAGEDRMLRLVSMLRTSQNKIYRQNVSDPSELATGFPTRAPDLFAYQGLIIGSVDASYFSSAQRELIREFVDRRGGGLLLLGGRYALADGGWASSDLAGILPTVLPSTRDTFHVDPATVQLTAAGADSAVTRLVDDPASNLERWRKLPYLMDYQNAGIPKPGAVVLANLEAEGRRFPFLVTENYGRGRTAIQASAGTWRWQMNLPLGDPSFQTYWQQLLRWLVTDTRGNVAASVDRLEVFDAARSQISAEVRDQNYEAVADAAVEAHILGPDGLAQSLPLAPSAAAPGRYEAQWSAPRPGDYLVEVGAARAGQGLGSDTVHFRRLDGVAENFHTQQNRALLERLAALTGGQYWRPQDMPRLAEQIALSSAGITVQTRRELWNMPAVLLLLLLLPLCEWLLRRRWGIV